MSLVHGDCYVKIAVYLHKTPAYPILCNNACYVMITMDRGSPSLIYVMWRRTKLNHSIKQSFGVLFWHKLLDISTRKVRTYRFSEINHTSDIWIDIWHNYTSGVYRSSTSCASCVLQNGFHFKIYLPLIDVFHCPT